MLIFMSFMLLASGYLTIPLQKVNYDNEKWHEFLPEHTSREVMTIQVLYYLPASVGTPSSDYSLLLDISAVNFIQFTWVEIANCSHCDGSRKQFNPNNSLTFENSEAHHSSNNLDVCQSSGNSFSDIITFHALPVELSARIEMVLANSQAYCSKFIGDGALGLRPPYMYMPDPMITNFKKLGYIESSLFALYIGPTSPDSKILQPSLEIGGYDLEKFSSDPSSFFTIPIQNIPIWAVEFDTILIPFLLYAENATVYLSSTIPYISGDMNYYFNLFPKLAALGLQCKTNSLSFIITCLENRNIKLPGLELSYEGNIISLGAEDLWQCEEGICTFLISFNFAGIWVFGQRFFERYYAVFDYENRTVGFAPALSKLVEIINDDAGLNEIVSGSIYYAMSLMGFSLII